MFIAQSLNTYIIGLSHLHHFGAITRDERETLSGIGPDEQTAKRLAVLLSGSHNDEPLAKAHDIFQKLSGKPQQRNLPSIDDGYKISLELSTDERVANHDDVRKMTELAFFLKKDFILNPILVQGLVLSLSRCFGEENKSLMHEARIWTRAYCSGMECFYPCFEDLIAGLWQQLNFQIARSSLLSEGICNRTIEELEEQIEIYSNGFANPDKNLGKYIMEEKGYLYTTQSSNPEQIVNLIITLETIRQRIKLIKAIVKKDRSKLEEVKKSFNTFVVLTNTIAEGYRLIYFPVYNDIFEYLMFTQQYEIFESLIDWLKTISQLKNVEIFKPLSKKIFTRYGRVDWALPPIEFVVP